MDQPYHPHKSEEDLSLSVEASSDSFWDIRNFQRVVKRIENGPRMCSDLVRMAQERVEIESKYARGLQQWSKKWDDIINKGPEYGTLETGWKACLKEAVKVADMHTEMCSKIQHEVIDTVQLWKGDHFHKTIRGLKEVKKAEESFALGQKPWVKRLDKTNRVKKAYHQAAYDLEVLQGRLRIAETSPEVSPEQCAKIREKHERAESSFDKALEKYKSRVGDIQQYKPRYVEDLTLEFVRCQEAEQARMEFFKAVLFKFKEALDISRSTSFSKLYSDYEESLSQISPEEDLKWYALNCGTGMSYNWPEFEPYIRSQNPKSDTQKRSSPTLKHGSQASTSSTNRLSSTHSRRSEHSSLAGSTASSSSPGVNSNQPIDIEAGYDSGDEDWMEPPPAQGSGSKGLESRESSEEPQGRLMRAIYDYTGPEKDDLSFKEGDIIRIMFEGENGWAEGMMGDKYGYVPISFLEAVV